MLPVYKSKISVFNYDEIPSGYYFKAMESGSSIQKYWHKRKFSALANLIQNGQKVLDLGCGPGSFLSVLAKARTDISATGADISSRQIEFAIEHVAPTLKKSKFNFEKLEPTSDTLPFADNNFDVVTCIEVIEHLHPFYAHRLLSEARRVLKPHGQLLVTTPNYRSLWPMIEVILEKLSAVKYHDQHINKFTPNALVKFLESAGFDVSSQSSIFVLAPFAAGISEKLADGLNYLEQALDFNFGSLLIAKCQKLQHSPQVAASERTHLSA